MLAEMKIVVEGSPNPALMKPPPPPIPEEENRLTKKVKNGDMGEVLKIDYNAQSGKRCQFARIAVLLDLTKPLKSMMMVDKARRQRIEYENLHIVCYRCARYSHTVDNCPLIPKETSSTKKNASGGANGHSSALPSRGGSLGILVSENMAGPWIHGSGRPKCLKVVHLTAQDTQKPSDSSALTSDRFRVLANVDEDMEQKDISDEGPHQLKTNVTQGIRKETEKLHLLAQPIDPKILLNLVPQRMPHPQAHP
ncbi:hypothetical protein Scep_023739 [Stephania cephalantha]|uniref:Zinc knuckle CX2CX4HX4C domain-containing protein n=1 Tax=Stephania cephalantha TaxID=152367 RepID=A0AAP0EVQ8_9MAGN